MPSSRIRVLLLSLICGASLSSWTACSGDDDPEGDLSSSQASAVYASVEQALRDVQKNIVPGIEQRNAGSDKSDTSDGGARPAPSIGDGGVRDRDGGQDWITGTLAGFQINGTLTNPNGAGTATVTGSGGRGAAGWTATVTITFSGWEVDSEMVIDGPLTVEYVLSTLSPLAMSLSINGTLKVTMGKVTLPALVTAQAEVAGQTYTVCGTIAGIPVGTGPCP